MKNPIPTPVLIGVVVVVVILIAAFFMKGMSDPSTPRPDPARFGGPPPTVPPTAP